MAKLFNTNVLSREELDDITNGGAGQAGPIEDQVIDDTNAEEAQVTQEEIEEAGEQVAEGNEVIDEANDNVEKIDNALGEGGAPAEESASSEEVAESEVQPTEGAPVSEAEGTPAIDGSESEASPVVPGQEPVQGEEAVIAATVATEALKYITNRIGLTHIYTPSHEANADPYQSLRLAREGFKDVIEKVWRAIREFLQKIWAKLKTWTAQIIGKIKNYEKTVADLKKRVEDAKSDLGTEIKEDDRKSLIKLCPYGVTLAGSGKFAATEAGNQLETAKSLIELVKRTTAYDSEKGSSALTEKIAGAAVDLRKSYKTPEGKGIFLPLRPTGVGLSVSYEDGKFRVSKTKLELSENAGKGFTKYLTKGEALNILSILDGAAKKFKADNDAILKAFEDGRKATDDALSKLKEANKDKDKVDDNVKAHMDQCRQASTIIAIGVPEVMFAKLDYFKAATTFVAKSLKAGSGDKSDKKEDKKEEGK